MRWLAFHFPWLWTPKWLAWRNSGARGYEKSAPACSRSDSWERQKDAHEVGRGI